MSKRTASAKAKPRASKTTRVSPKNLATARSKPAASLAAPPELQPEQPPAPAELAAAPVGDPTAALPDRGIAEKLRAARGALDAQRAQVADMGRRMVSAETPRAERRALRRSLIDGRAEGRALAAALADLRRTKRAAEPEAAPATA